LREQFDSLLAALLYKYSISNPIMRVPRAGDGNFIVLYIH